MLITIPACLCLQVENKNPQVPSELKEIQFDLEDFPESIVQ